MHLHSHDVQACGHESTVGDDLGERVDWIRHSVAVADDQVLVVDAFDDEEETALEEDGALERGRVHGDRERRPGVREDRERHSLLDAEFALDLGEEDGLRRSNGEHMRLRRMGIDGLRVLAVSGDCYGRSAKHVRNCRIAPTNIEVAVADHMICQRLLALEVEGAVVYRVPDQIVTSRARIPSKGQADIRRAEEVEDDLLLVGDGRDRRTV